MAKVFKGKVLIPADKLDEYFDAMAEAEAARKPFRDHFENLLQDFDTDLSTKYSNKTVKKHVGIVALFIEFICLQTDVEEIEEITKGMVNTHFRNWYKRKVWDTATENDLRVSLRKFFRYLAAEKNMVNQKALKALG